MVRLTNARRMDAHRLTGGLRRKGAYRLPSDLRLVLLGLSHEELQLLARILVRQRLPV